MLPQLNPLLHSQLRLQIVTLLAGLESAEFNYLMKETGASRGNLSVQINKLKEAGYLSVKKSFGESYPVTNCSLTNRGRDEFKAYLKGLETYIKAGS